MRGACCLAFLHSARSAPCVGRSGVIHPPPHHQHLALPEAARRGEGALIILSVSKRGQRKVFEQNCPKNRLRMPGAMSGSTDISIWGPEGGLGVT